MLLILKIPLVWVCVVVWYAIKAEPTPPDVRGRRRGRHASSRRLAATAA